MSRVTTSLAAWRARGALAAVSLVMASAAMAQVPPSAAEDPALAVRDTLAQRMQACVMCHGKEGRSTRDGYFPRIAGKPEGYLYHQLQNFKTGRRHNAAMNHLLQHLSDDYLRAIAGYFAALDLPYPASQPHGLDEAQVRLAETLVFDGVPARRLPACVSCHGQQMAGKLPAMPGLLTLPQDYLMAQMGAWRAGSRHALAPDCMADVARRLTPQEVGVVARWLSARTPPPGTRPEASSTRALPMPCGSGAP